MAAQGGRLATADKQEAGTARPPEPGPGRGTGGPEQALRHRRAISKVNEEANPETLKGYMDTEKRRTVIDAPKSRLGGPEGAAE